MLLSAIDAHWASTVVLKHSLPGGHVCYDCCTCIQVKLTSHCHQADSVWASAYYSWPLLPFMLSRLSSHQR